MQVLEYLQYIYTIIQLVIYHIKQKDLDYVTISIIPMCRIHQGPIMEMHPLDKEIDTKPMNGSYGK